MEQEEAKATEGPVDCSDMECQECEESPWPHGTGYITTVLFGMPGMMGAYALLKKAPLRLPVFGGIWGAIFTVMRKIVCCRCDYYGKECSTLMGKWTAMIYEKDEEHPLTTEAFYADFGLIAASILFPLPQVKKMGARYLAAYIFITLGSLLAIRQLACSHCPNDVCFNNPGFTGRKRA